MNQITKTILFATTNNGKVLEVASYLKKYDIRVLGLKDFKVVESPLENGTTFFENAMIKAKYYFDLLKIPCITDDSGLEVEALNGEPGINSARYASKTDNQDEANTKKLLNKMEKEENRRAQFVCAMVYYDKNNVYHTAGTLQGLITTSKKGNNGFGYDPVFLPDGFNETLAEISLENKNQISHRYQALTKLIGLLKENGIL